MIRYIPLTILLLMAIAVKSVAQVTYPGTEPGKAVSSSGSSIVSLSNHALAITFKVVANKLVLESFTDKEADNILNLRSSPLFRIDLPHRGFITSSEFIVIGKGIQVRSDTGKNAGKSLVAVLYNKRWNLTVDWEARLDDHANYIRQIVSISPGSPIQIESVRLININNNRGFYKGGEVDGSPLIKGNMFFALEHPMSSISLDNGLATAKISRLVPLTAAAPLTLSAVWGVTPPNQLRRGFLYYIERERAVPYHQMLHYNSWFDISYGILKLNDSLCLDRIKVFGDSLMHKRNVKMRAFLFDDGWDDPRTLWKFNSGFKDGFSEIRSAAEKLNTGIGVWISPWGGYDKPKLQRIEFGKTQKPPFETNDNGFALSGKVYKKRFTSVSTDFVKKYNVSMFKFDGVGAGNGASGASLKYQKDIEALLRLITNLRAIKPNLYFSLTVGTWPSVYWLKYGDVIWRAGEDTGLDGEGPKRQRWITYRDGQVYKNIVKRAPLYPLNALMSHGIVIAGNGLPDSLEMDNKNIQDEIWSFFGTGTSLQELYINPHLLNSANWDCLSKAAKWSERNESLFDDVHWCGGDPAKGEVYGYAAWKDGKGVLTLRNPGTDKRKFQATVSQLLDIPQGDGDNYAFCDTRSNDYHQISKGRLLTIELAPFQTLVMDAIKLK
ncbi:enterotoxin [Mucilaginibacter sp. HC2]|uniref:enterotoxin n=1 Tax=Mucilaginibacter inviolabilis TaxID=2714892 RepID=UPI00140E6C25|nr:enterotoxin [Mucilaginibacter inviolabilis]NHA02408.1 enterotoxin [Mucilaginibacter inviolabilis]